MSPSTIEFRNRVMLAPMMRGCNAGLRLYADKGCGEVGGGATLQYGQMAMAQWVRARNPRDLKLVSPWKETAFCPQLAANHVEDLMEAAKIAQDLGAKAIDLNASCPKAFAQRHDIGASLLRRKNLSLLGALVAGLKRAVTLPITVKVRAGWSREMSSPQIDEITRIVEESGADAMTVHARYAFERYDTKADWSVIGRAVAARKSMPIVGNGDIRSFFDVGKMRKETGCDSVMIGRAALIRPWIFEEIRKNQTVFVDPKTRWEEFALIMGNIRNSGQETLRDYFDLLRFHAGWFIAWYRAESWHRTRWKKMNPQTRQQIIDDANSIYYTVQAITLKGPKKKNPPISFKIFQRGDVSQSKG